MKKNYLLVLFALLTFALSINAQESTDQEETYNMTVTLPDGTSLIVNTNDVDEVTFSEGKLNVSGTSINEIVQKIRQVLEEIGANKMSIDEAKAYIQDLVKKVNNQEGIAMTLATYVEENRTRAAEALDRAEAALLNAKDAMTMAEQSMIETQKNANSIEIQQTRLELVESALQSVSSCMCDHQQAIEAYIIAVEARDCAKATQVLAEKGITLTQQNTDAIMTLKEFTDQNMTDIAQLKDVASVTKMELNDAIFEMRVRADILGDSIASVLSEVSSVENLAQQAIEEATETRQRLEELRQLAYTLASTVEPKLKELEDVKAMLIETVNAQQNMINNLTTTVAAQDAKIATQDANIANLQHVISELMQRVEALENK